MSRRTFDGLRDAAPPAIQRTGEEPIEQVLTRWRATPDGARILGWMQAETGRATPLNCSEAVLREAEGARRFVEAVIKLSAA